MRGIAMLAAAAAIGCVHRSPDTSAVVSERAAAFLAREAVTKQWGWGHDAAASLDVLAAPSEDERSWALRAFRPATVGVEAAVVFVSADGRQISVHPLWCTEDVLDGSPTLVDLGVVSEAKLDELRSAVPTRQGRQPITVCPNPRFLAGRACCPVPRDPPLPDRQGLGRRN